jgi:predicted HD phosphohydrolase
MRYPRHVDVIDETAALLASLHGIWDEVAVDELDHALQCGYLALHDGGDDELVLAGVLHDIGHSPLLGPAADHHHDKAARDWLTPRFGARVGWLAGAHVAAKQYLAATEDGYAAALSEVSTTSLTHQGGAGVEADITAHPWWSDAVQLRRCDDRAKVPGAPALSIREVLQIATRVGGVR